MLQSLLLYFLILSKFGVHVHTPPECFQAVRAESRTMVDRVTPSSLYTALQGWPFSAVRLSPVAARPVPSKEDSAACGWALRSLRGLGPRPFVPLPGFNGLQQLPEPRGTLYRENRTHHVTELPPRLSDARETNSTLPGCRKSQAVRALSLAC